MSKGASHARRRALRYLAMLVVAGLGLWLAWELLPVLEWMRRFIGFIDSLGVWAALTFGLIYIVAAVIGFPRTPMNIAAGILFSYWVALAVVLLSASVAFFATFEIARHFAREWVTKRLRRFKDADRIVSMVEEECFKMVFLIRLNPFVPGFLKGYTFGTTDMPLRTYLMASVLGFLPIGAAHVYLGWLGGAAMMHPDHQPETWKLAVLVGGAVISVILLVVISWYGHRALRPGKKPKGPSPRPA